jgi:ribonuclease HII
MIEISEAIGLDEAGRGPLAGPVCAAAVWLPPGVNIRGLDDSKKLSPLVREELAGEIKRRAFFGIGWAWEKEIDQMNILRASLLAMERALASLQAEVKQVLVDGNHVPRVKGYEFQAVVKGDQRVACIAAASILAKTERDAWMKKMAGEYPLYGFDRHFGYATRAHLRALREYGPCEIHRRTFRPVREMIEQRCLIVSV